MRLKPGTLAMTAVLGLLTALGPLATDITCRRCRRSPATSAPRRPARS